MKKKKVPVKNTHTHIYVDIYIFVGAYALNNTF